jgi:cytochrome c-type biogenesis protein CcmH
VRLRRPYSRAPGSACPERSRRGHRAPKGSSLGLAVSIVAIAVATGWAQNLDTRAQAIAAKLRCPVCQNESVADSPAELAAQMRALIREKLAAGESDDQIVAYFVSRYGEWILLEPPRRGMLWAVWLAPAGALLVGLWMAGSYVRRAVKR